MPVRAIMVPQFKYAVDGVKWSLDGLQWTEDELAIARNLHAAPYVFVWRFTTLDEVQRIYPVTVDLAAPPSPASFPAVP